MLKSKQEYFVSREMKFCFLKLFSEALENVPRKLSQDIKLSCKY